MTGRLVALVLASSLAAAPVMAQPTATQQKQANELVKQAIDKNGQGKFLEAVDLYLKAYDLVPLPLLLSNVGTNYQHVGKKPEALTYFCRYLAEEKDVTSVNYQYGKTQAKALQLELGNTNVTDDDVCAAPVAPPPPVDPAPTPTPTPAPITTDRGDESPGKALRMTGLGVAGVGVVTVGVGLFFGVKALGISNDISEHPMDQPWDEDIEQRERDGQRYEDLQVKLMIAGGIVAVAGGIVYFVGRSKGKARADQLTVAPTASPDGAGLVFGGRF